MIDHTNAPMRAVLLGIQLPLVSAAQLQESLDELRQLLVGLECCLVGQIHQQRPVKHPTNVFGEGKLQEIKHLVHAKGADLAVFDGSLSPAQGRKLESVLEVMVADRTQVILDIFSKNARTREAHKQVELARLEYTLPRLVGMWAHLDRERGGIAGGRGAGEKQIDLDRTLLRSRIARLRKELHKLDTRRRTHVKKRRSCLKVSLVGYTNAGKSTLMNRLTNAHLLTQDRLFATLDSTTRQLDAQNPPPILISDTVGFIRNLPHQLVASFRSTLQVVIDADLLLHVVDISHPNFQEQMAVTKDTLKEIGADTIPMLVVFNKTDKTSNTQKLLAKQMVPQAVFTSAINQDTDIRKRDIRKQDLRKRISDFFSQSMRTAKLTLPCTQEDLYLLHRWSHVQHIHQVAHHNQEVVFSCTPDNLARILAHFGPVELLPNHAAAHTPRHTTTNPPKAAQLEERQYAP